LIGDEEDPDFRPAWIHRLEAIEIAGLGIRQQYQNGVGPNKTCADAILPKGHK